MLGDTHAHLDHEPRFLRQSLLAGAAEDLLLRKIAGYPFR